ncbi:MAG: DUF1330 domain-containing protein [Chloroflexota bacterium]
MTSEKALLITLAAPNPDEQAAAGQYGRESGTLTSQYGANVITRLAITEKIHGDGPAALLGIAEFPSADSIRALFSSDEYKKLIPVRDKAMRSVNLYISQPDQSVENVGGLGKSLLITMAAPNPDEKDALGQYQQGAGPLAGKYGAKPLANVGIAEQIHGDSPAAFVSIAEFPDDDSVKGFFNDEDYQKLIPVRDRALRAINLYLAS